MMSVGHKNIQTAVYLAVEFELFRLKDAVLDFLVYMEQVPRHSDFLSAQWSASQKTSHLCCKAVQRLLTARV